MSAHYVVLSTYLPVEDRSRDVLISLGTSSPNRLVGIATDASDVIEIETLNSLEGISSLESIWEDRKTSVAAFLRGDVRRQILSFIEAPKDCASPLPETPCIQLRYVEVRPPMYDAYRTWREETIFQVVREASEVSTFLAYHTLISTQPGVMFISGFDTDEATYASVFSTPRYKRIVQQAGDTYITGGTSGLYTKIYYVSK